MATAFSCWRERWGVFTVVSRLLGLDVIGESFEDQVMERLGRRGDDPLVAGC